jgi:rhodanese-related sulfurtransferase
MNMASADLVDEAGRGIRELPPRAVGAYCVLIDVREPAECATGHIPAAINLPRGFRIDAHPALPAGFVDPEPPRRRRPIVLYCRTGVRAALAAQALQRLGFDDACSIAGGIVARAEAGLPVADSAAVDS